MRRSVAEFSREHKWEIILGLVFAVLFGVAWEVVKVGLERAEHVTPERLAAGTVRVIVAINLLDDAQRKAVAEWRKQHPGAVATNDFAFLQMGSGFSVTDDGWIVTARHVVRMSRIAPLLAATHAKPYFVVVYPPSTDRRATLIEEDPKSDTAILKTANPPRHSFLVLGEPERVQRLDRVVAAGYPSAADYSSPFEPSMTAGEISKIGEADPIGITFQTTAPISSGNSGGPLIDSEGHVIALNVAIPTEKDIMLTFAVPVDHAHRLLERHGVKLPRAYEHQGIVRQPWFAWGFGIAIVALLFAQFGVSLRAFWRRRLKIDADLPYAGFWIRFAAVVIDIAITLPVWLLLIVGLVFVTGRFFPWYESIFAYPLVWCIYAALCEWRWGATLGKRAAGLRVETLTLARAFGRGFAHLLSLLPLGIGFIAAAFDPRRRAWHDRIADTVVIEKQKRSPWAMLVITILASLFTFMAFMAHWGILAAHATSDLQQIHAAMWTSPNARLMSKADDRACFVRRFPAFRDEIAFDYGLDLMLAGQPRKAIDAFAWAAGEPWEALQPGNGLSHSSTAYDAATKAGWCSFDLGDYRRAREMFDLAGERSSDVDAILGLGVTQMRSGDVDGARATCTRARNADPKLDQRLASGNPLRLTPSQTAAARELLALCGG